MTEPTRFEQNNNPEPDSAFNPIEKPSSNIFKDAWNAIKIIFRKNPQTGPITPAKK